MGHKGKTFLDDLNSHPGPGDYETHRASNALVKSKSVK